MTKKLRRSALVLVTAGALTTALAVPASADNNIQDGLVNLAVGRITVTDVNVGVAAQVAAAICGLDVGPISVIGLAVDAGTPGPVLCTVVNQPVQLVQN